VFSTAYCKFGIRVGLKLLSLSTGRCRRKICFFSIIGRKFYYGWWFAGLIKNTLSCYFNGYRSYISQTTADIITSFFTLEDKFTAFCSKVLPGISMKSKNFATLVLYLSLVTGDLIAFRNNFQGSISGSSSVLVFLKGLLILYSVKPP
jgi:hypothetical protein